MCLSRNDLMSFLVYSPVFGHTKPLKNSAFDLICQRGKVPQPERGARHKNSFPSPHKSLPALRVVAEGLSTHSRVIRAAGGQQLAKPKKKRPTLSQKKGQDGAPANSLSG